MLRAASVGLGWWSNELAAAVQGKSDRLKIVTCTSRSAENRTAFSRKFATAEHESYEAVLADPAIDAVILTTPHSQHATHVEAAAAAGKHVFVEKPFTLTAASGRKAAAACARAGLVLAVGHNRRFAPALLHLQRMLTEDAFGTLLHAEANFSAPGALSYTPDRWRANRVESPGGAIAALGIHMIDCLTILLGPIATVSARATRRAVPVDIDDTTSAIFSFARGATGYLGTLFACPKITFLFIYGTKANAFARIDENWLAIQQGGEAHTQVNLPQADTLRAELEEFAAACHGEIQFRVRPEEAIHDVAVMEAMVASAATQGAPVILDATAEQTSLSHGR